MRKVIRVYKDVKARRSRFKMVFLSNQFMTPFRND